MHEAGNPFRANYDGMSGMIGTAYGGIINTHLYNGIKEYSSEYEYGFTFGGLFVLGFVQWLHRYCLDHKIERILFLARDGEIYDKVFNRLFNDIPINYVYWSRIVNSKLTVEKDRYNFIQRVVRAKAKAKEDITIKEILETFNLTMLISELQNYRLQPNTVLTQTNSKQLETLLIDNWSKVVAAYEDEGELAKEYISKLISDSNKILVVDTGWQGTGPIGLKWLIEKKWKLNCKVDCVLAAAQAQNPDVALFRFVNNEIKSYLFDYMHNRINYNHHKYRKSGINSYLFELFTQSGSPTFVGFYRRNDNSIGFRFGLAEVENYKVIKEVQEGIIDFCDIYSRTFANYPYMFNISGYDAYVPFRFISKDLDYFKKVFGELSYSVVTDPNAKKDNILTYKDILDDQL